MSIFGKIASAIFGHRSVAPGTATGSLAPGAPKAPGSAAPGSAAPGSAAPGSAAAPASTTGTSAAGAAKPITIAEVEAMISKVAAGQKEKLDWQRSIVDLMKLLNLDSSLHARKELAQELGYTGSLDGSAEMNVWLHKQVMTKLAESGGKVPDSLRA
jgi:3-oxoacyl-ACP reductase-like protein